MNLTTIGQYKFIVKEGPILEVWSIEVDEGEPPMLRLDSNLKNGLSFQDESEAYNFAVEHFTEVENNNQQPE